MDTTSMPDRFVGCTTIAETNIRYKQLFAEINETEKVITKQSLWRLQEDHRLAMVYLGERARGSRSRPVDDDGMLIPKQRRRREVPRPVEHDDGRVTMTCRECGDEKPINKFPTRSGKPGMRDDRCRGCRDANKKSDVDA